MKEIYQFLVILVYVIVLKHRKKKQSFLRYTKNVSFQLHYAEYCATCSLVFCMHDGEINLILIPSSSEHRFQLGRYVKAVRI